jgi:dimethylglycine dehydrogenase
LLQAAGQRFGLRPFGGRALNALRIEKNFGTWAREYRPIYGPYEAALGRFVDARKDSFIGRAAALEERQSGGALRLVAFEVDATDADAIGDEPIWHGDSVIGWVTSGAFGHRVHRSLALGYVPASLASEKDFQIEIIGERHDARRLEAAPYDPEGARMRG